MNRAAALVVVSLAVLAVPTHSRAHCDTLDGPVATVARAALEGGDAAPLLAWVKADDEAELRSALARARAARKAGKEAREVADTWFLETVVRVHRAGEGAPFTGLKPAGGAVEPSVAAVDRAIAAKDPRAIEELLVRAVREGLHARWTKLAAERRPGADVAAGRRWVAEYVPLVHWAEGVEKAAGADPHAAHAGHAAPAGAAPDAHAGHEPAREAMKPEHGHGR